MHLYDTATAFNAAFDGMFLDPAEANDWMYMGRGTLSPHHVAFKNRYTRESFQFEIDHD
jgi:hypothetical protein